MRGGITFCRDRNSVTDENPLPIGYSVERGSSGRTEGEVGVTMRSFLRTTALLSTLAVIVIFGSAHTVQLRPRRFP